MKSFRTMGVAATALAASQIPVTLASIEDPGVQRTPPMGFNNWARFECALNESLFVATADAMARNGMRDAGYEWINIDDCWLQHTRSADGRLRWNETLFPRGLVWLGEYIKARGFRFGIYEDAGNATCGGYPGSQGHEQLDAQTFQEWGIEYLKLDGCNVDPGTEEQYYGLYDTWHRIFSAMKNPFVFSESAPAYFSGTNNNTDWYRVMDWVPRLGELARHSTDIAVYDLYGNDSSKYWDSIMTNYGFEVLLARYQRPGYHNDPDFIIADWPQLTLDEKKSHFALWASFSAPLIVSSYIPDLTADELAYLTNRAIIAVDQDALSLQATLVSQDGRFDVLTKSLANGDRLLTVLNRGANTASTTVDLARVGLNRQSQYTFTDLWSGSASKHSGSIKITLPTHATAIYRISGVKSVTPTGMLFNTASNKCLTAASRGSGVGFATCAGTDAQVWTVTNGPRGAVVRPLSQPTTCLTANGGKGVSLQRCSGASKNSGWTYAVTGNLMIAGTSTCLQETSSGGAVLATCGDERDSQVFGLPSGVDVQWS